MYDFKKMNENKKGRYKSDDRESIIYIRVKKIKREGRVVVVVVEHHHY